MIIRDEKGNLNLGLLKVHGYRTFDSGVIFVHKRYINLWANVTVIDEKEMI